MAWLAASGGDTVKLFDVSVETGDPCTLSYTPSPGFQLNSVQWNRANLVVASAGDDKKISLWRKNGQSMGTISSSDSGDNIEEAISSISFSNKTSRYLCSGGSGQVVRIWDLQRKRCIKWLKGHTGSISGATYNCKDEHLASISVSGDLIVHNLASGARAAELKDPHGQVLRVLDYSRSSRHLLATAGDDGSVHMWDTTGRSPKVSWLKQHSAPTSGLSFSPSNDKVIATVGLDKRLYTFDSGTRKSTSCISYEAPFSSSAFRDDGWILAAGTSNGRVVFYDVRGKPQPFTVLCAYSNSEDTILSPLSGSTPNAFFKPDDSSSITPPEAWGSERLSDKFALHRQIGSLPSRFSMLTSGSNLTSILSGLQDPSSASQSTMNYSTSSNLFSANLRAKEISSSLETLPGIPAHVPFSSLPMNLGPKSFTGPTTPESPGPSSFNLSRRFSTYAERISTNASFTVGVSALSGLPKTKKSGAETREELLNSLLSRSDKANTSEPRSPIPANGMSTLHRRSQSDVQQGNSSFTLQLFQRTLDETLGTFQKLIHEDVRNLHIEILRQFHMQEMEMSSAMNSIRDNQAALLKEVQALRKENERLRQLL